MLLYLSIPFVVALVYLVYTRAIRMYIKRSYYERQGVVFAKGMVPVLGHLPRFKHQLDTYGTNEHPWRTTIREDMGSHKLPKVIGMFNSFEPTFYITDPEMMSEAYLAKNRHFDKHEGVSNALYTLTGENVFFMKSTE